MQNKALQRNATFTKKAKLSTKNWKKTAKNESVLYGSWTSSQCTFYSVTSKAILLFWSWARNVNWVRWAHMVEILLAKIECKEIDTNHWQKWVSTDFPSPNADAISSSKYEFASRTCRRNLTDTSYSDERHVKMTNKHLRSARVIMNMQNEIWPIR